MFRTRVKICGIKTLEDAMASIEAGADALGFNFWPRSPRWINPEAASAIVHRLPPFVATVGVFVNEEPDAVVSIARQLNLSAVQLHGDESIDYCRDLTGPSKIKALRVGADFRADIVADYPVDMILLDSSPKGAFGGTGETFDWRAAIDASHHCRIILAGGLNPANVADAISRVRPYAVDVCSGVEAEAGRKDLTKLALFLKEVARADLAAAEIPA